jgi:hypothetical protein
VSFAIIFLFALLWIIVAIVVWVAADDGGMSNRQAIGTGLIWPVIAIIYAVRAILEALAHAFEPGA